MQVNAQNWKQKNGPCVSASNIIFYYWIIITDALSNVKYLIYILEFFFKFYLNFFNKV